MKFLCDNCKAKYQIGDEKVAGKTVRMKCRRCGHNIVVSARVTEGSVSRKLPGFDGGAGTPPNPPTESEAATEIAPASARTNTELETVAKSPPPPVSHEGLKRPIGLAKPPPPAPSNPSLFESMENEDENTKIMTGPPAVFRPKPVPPAPVKPAPVGAPKPAPVGVARPGAAPGRPAPPPPRAAPPPRPSSPLAARDNTAKALEPVAPPRANVSARERPANEGGQRTVPERGMAAAFNRAVVDQPGQGTQPAKAPLPEDWYVGVGGVPIGPIRLAAIREKAQAGLIDLDSLVWREGFDEWSPLKKFPELAELVLKAQQARREQSQPSRKIDVAPDHASELIAATNETLAAAASTLAQPASLYAPEHAAPTTAAIAAAAAALTPSVSRPGVHPIAPFTPTPAPVDRMSASSIGGTVTSTAGGIPLATPSANNAALDVLADPFAPRAPAITPGASTVSPAAVNGAAHPTPAPIPVSPLVTAREEAELLALTQPRRGMHPVAYAFIAMAAVFGGVAAYVLLSRQPPPPQIVVMNTPVQQQAAPEKTAGAGAPGDTPVVTATPDGTTAPAAKVIVASGGGPGPKSNAAVDPKAGTPPPAIDTSGFNHGGVAGPTNDNGNAGPNNTQSQLSQGEIQSVVSSNQARVRRKCWEPALAAKPPNAPANARVSASITIGPSGAVDVANASGADAYPGLASCIQSMVKSFKFPASNGSTPVSIPFVFAGQ